MFHPPVSFRALISVPFVTSKIQFKLGEGHNLGDFVRYFKGAFIFQIRKSYLFDFGSQLMQQYSCDKELLKLYSKNTQKIPDHLSFTLRHPGEYWGSSERHSHPENLRTITCVNICRAVPKQGKVCLFVYNIFLYQKVSHSLPKIWMEKHYGAGSKCLLKATLLIELHFLVTEKKSFKASLTNLSV